MPATFDPSRLEELGLYLRPPGQGIYAVSTGKQSLEDATREYLGPGWDPERPWREHLAATIPDEGVAILGIPSDTGAGIVRGAAWGAMAIRSALGREGVHPHDLGDVVCIPHLLDDEMLSTAQIERSQDALYPGVETTRRRRLPVSPLSIAQRTISLLRQVVPRLKLLVLGGDHTVSWAPVAVLLSQNPEDNADVGFVHFDAHTDLLPERLGVRYCFATWAHHANLRLGGGQRLLQIGIRASGHDRGHWERTGVRQIWAQEALSMSPVELADRVVDHLESRQLRRIYVTNDIDGTDLHWAAACGTPEPGGLTPDHVVAVLHALRGRFEPLGADLVEVAPGLSLDREASERTVSTAALYARHALTLFHPDFGNSLS